MVLTRVACRGHLPAETARTSTSFTIFAGTSEIQRVIIGRAVTGLDVRLAAASANTINCYLDRDIDAVMRRTARRPLARPAAATITPREAIAFGIRRHSERH